MKINYLKTIGFRKFEKEFETELYDVTKITGKNRAGKSNILFAIINIFLGTNLTGDDKSCLINKNCDSSYGEIHFTDNIGQNHVLIRSKNKYNNKENYLLLDGKAIKQDELIRFYKDKRLLLSIMNPMYFIKKKPAEQKEMVDKYLSDIQPNNCMNIAFNNLDKEEQKILESVPLNIPAYIIEINESIKKLQNDIKILDGKIEYAEKIAHMEVAKRKKFNNSEKLEWAKQELERLNKSQLTINKEKQTKLIEQIEKDIISKQVERDNLEKKMKEGKVKYLKVKNSLQAICPTCNQHIVDGNREIAATNMYNELMGYFKRNNTVKVQIQDLKIRLATEKCNLHAIEGKTAEDSTKRISNINKMIKELEQERVEIQKFNREVETKEKMINDSIIDLEKFDTERKVQKRVIEKLTMAKRTAQKLYISYIEEKLKLAKKYLRDVDIKFYSLVKTTGEIKEDFIITYKNNPLQNLSKSETIATSLEFANMFNKISKVNFPIFIDDYESCADYDFISYYAKDTQIIISNVEKGKSLKISDANSSKCTVIKSENIQINSATNLKEVA